MRCCLLPRCCRWSGAARRPARGRRSTTPCARGAALCPTALSTRERGASPVGTLGSSEAWTETRRGGRKARSSLGAEPFDGADRDQQRQVPDHQRLTSPSTSNFRADDWRRPSSRDRHEMWTRAARHDVACVFADAQVGPFGVRPTDLRRSRESTGRFRPLRVGEQHVRPTHQEAVTGSDHSGDARTRGSGLCQAGSWQNVGHSPGPHGCSAAQRSTTVSWCTNRRRKC